MTRRVPRGTLLAATLALLATTALAQQQQEAPAQAPAPAATPAPAPAPAPAAAALPPGSPLIGRPDNNPAAAKLAPVPAPPLATAENKLPLDKLKAPKGFNIEVYASGMPNARSMALDEKGTVFVGSRLQDKVYAITNKDGKRQVHVLVSGLYRPNGVAYKNGTLYIAELSQISKIDNVEDQIDKSPKPVVIYKDLPKDEAHGWKFLAIGPDNKLYFEVGQPGNNVLHDDNHGQMRRMNLDGTGAEKIAFGIRNTVGFDWNPKTHELYFTDNGRDWLSEDLPNDELNRITKLGQDFGEPYCHQGNIPDIEFGWGHDCKDYVPPIALMGPHAAALGMRFYTGIDVPVGISRPDLRRPPRLVEQEQEIRRRHRAGQAQQGRFGEIGRAVHHRLPAARQQLCRPAGRRDEHAGRFDADLRRLERRDLAPHLRSEQESRGPLEQDAASGVDEMVEGGVRPRPVLGEAIDA